METPDYQSAPLAPCSANEQQEADAASMVNRAGIVNILWEQAIMAHNRAKAAQEWATSATRRRIRTTPSSARNCGR